MYIETAYVELHNLSTCHMVHNYPEYKYTSHHTQYILIPPMQLLLEFQLYLLILVPVRHHTSVDGRCIWAYACFLNLRSQ